MFLDNVDSKPAIDIVYCPRIIILRITDLDHKHFFMILVAKVCIIYFKSENV